MKQTLSFAIICLHLSRTCVVDSSTYQLGFSNNKRLLCCDNKGPATAEAHHAITRISSSSSVESSNTRMTRRMRYPAPPLSATLQASSSRKTVFDPSQYYADASDIDSDFDPNFIPKLLEDQGVFIAPPSRSSSSSSSIVAVDEPELPPALLAVNLDSDEDNDSSQQANGGDQRLPHSPVIFRYYGKSRSRTQASGSIPFILLGPDIDHWRTTGEHLAARGFSVIACERDPLEHDEDNDDGNTSGGRDASITWNEDEWWKGTDGEGANLVLNVLQASRWTKAILVACDSEAVIAIQAVIALAPEKIAGVVFCGDLKEVDAFLLQSHPHLSSQEGDFAIDAFLRSLLPCPFAIAWDGKTLPDTLPLATPSEYDGSSPAECLHGNRCLILGGGIAPHRRQPETFSWILTRFVEGKVAPSIPIAEQRKLFRRVKKVDKKANEDGPRLPAMLAGVKNAFSSSFLSGDYFSTGSFCVYGRVIASALLYASMLKVGIYQYSNFLDGMVNMKSRYDGVQRIRRNALGLVAGFFLNFGYVPLLFKRKEEELDLVDYAGLDPLASFEHEGDMAEETESDTQSEEEVAVEQSGDEEALEGESIDESSDEEDEERRAFQPLFFLDRVVA